MISEIKNIPFTEVKIKEKLGKKGGEVAFGKGNKRRITLHGTKGAVEMIMIGDVKVYPPLVKPKSYAEQGRDISDSPELKEREKDKFEEWKKSTEKWFKVPMIYVEGVHPYNMRADIEFYIKEGVIEEKDTEKVQEFLKSARYVEIQKYFKMIA